MIIIYIKQLFDTSIGWMKCRDQYFHKSIFHIYPFPTVMLYTKKDVNGNGNGNGDGKYLVI
jgi:hypothetical protein